MKLYKTTRGIVLNRNNDHFILENEDWDALINDDNVFSRLSTIADAGKPQKGLLENGVLPPVGRQEIWAAGVTYFRSKVGRQEESKTAGGGDFYARVYEAKRPELFFKSPAYRAVGHGDKVRIRKDSTWDVPEPELTLVISASGKIIGYTIGNDMSSRSIEGENPLYLPQAKCYDKSAAVGPCVFVTDKPLPPDTSISVEIHRGTKVFEGKTGVDQIKRSFQELVGYLFMETTFPYGCLLMTGTGIVPPNDFTLQKNDEIRITIDSIGTLINTVE
ncbi:MAG TPA: fumarylacetoacetate hydrolase family protein [Chryseosolibacter sp.]|nr:fumarylacetoacetate hydrolase family protein [Chryseosolibacter sp.]